MPLSRIGYLSDALLTCVVTELVPYPLTPANLLQVVDSFAYCIAVKGIFELHGFTKTSGSLCG
ncbi:predicted protein [Plenodomus lingam JN3]|uniref:Predicted protein n=1 Tax=Leptosphaeria maculans (strain JN3 / isolate v23.1.3 / race Av1-4-5-6-7-8) TaxID=985895 RepID=E4ZXJ2_LEPMJ|nr:predicted protein [Plenodomus lingam JN3]CBX95402.1 predicted protein [Plenodomus lingam JN3]